MSSTFSSRLRIFRQRHGLSQEAMAEKLGVERNYVGMLEGGKRDPSQSLQLLFGMLEDSPLNRYASETVGEASLPADEQFTRMAESPATYVTGARGALQAALREAKMTPSDLAKRIGYQGRVIEELVNGRGRISTPMFAKIRAVFPHLDETLLEGSDSPRLIDHSGTTGTMGDRALIQGKGTRLIPLISEAQAGPNAAFTDDFYTHEGVSVDEDLDDRMAFALTIRGDSMEDKISEGDRVVICPSWELRNGDIVICRISKTQDVMCKIYQPKSGGKAMVLSSYNSGAYPPRDFLARELDWIFPVAEIRKRTRR